MTGASLCIVFYTAYAFAKAAAPLPARAAPSFLDGAGKIQMARSFVTLRP